MMVKRLTKLKDPNKRLFMAKIYLLVMVGIGYCGSWVFTVMALQSPDIMTTMLFVIVTTPAEYVFTMAFSSIFLKRRINVLMIFASFVALAGIVGSQVFKYKGTYLDQF